MTATLTVDLGAVAANVTAIRGRTSAQLMAVVKADGFGHGAIDVARTALQHGASWLGVTSLTEACALRSAGLWAPVLSWLNPVDADWPAAAALGIDVAVPSRAHLEAVSRAGQVRPIRVHLHADVGLARDGAARESWASLARAACRAEAAGRIRVMGLMGHLAHADDGPDLAGRRHFGDFVSICSATGLRAELRHLAGTAATLTDPLSHHDLCRVGAGLVGIDPSGTTGLSYPATLRAPVVGVRDVGAATGVGYGHDHVTSGPTRLALLEIGYADGLPRAAGGRGEVALQGRRCPIVGRVSMDQVVVDVGELTVRIGEEAVLFGAGEAGEPTIADWARWADTIPHEIVTGLGARVVRHVVPARSAVPA